MVEDKLIKCPICGSDQIKNEFGEVMVCAKCNHKFNVHLPQPFSPKIMLLSIFLIVGLLAIVKFSIPKFDAQQAMAELKQQQIKTLQSNYITKAKVIEKNLLYVSKDRIWLSEFTQSSGFLNIELLIVDAKNQEKQQAILLDKIKKYDDLDNTISAVAFKNILYILVNHHIIYGINLASKKIVVKNEDFISKYRALNNGIQKIEYNKGFKAFSFQNLDGEVLYYFPPSDLFVSSKELAQLRKSEQLNDNWKFEKIYIIQQGKLLRVTKKYQEYTMELSSSDIQMIQEGATWMKKNYGIITIQPILDNVDFSNTEILYSSENEIICVSQNKNEIIYYNFEKNNNWHRTIDNIRNKILSANIQGNEIVLYHSSNAYSFDKENGSLIWKY